LYSESGQVGQGCGQQTVLRAIKAKSQTSTRSCILSTLEHLKITLPNSYFKKLSGGEVSFLIPPVTFKHFTVHGSPIEHLRIIYSVGFLNSNGIFTFPDQFFASQTNEFLNFVLCVIPIASQWQPQNREKILGQRSHFNKLKQELTAAVSSKPSERPRSRRRRS
jgi:hypothetical protein